jgi:hypothetical protein
VTEEGIMYKVRWSGFGEDHDTWEPQANMETCREKVREYEEARRRSAAETRNN